ncbi:MAG: HD domain-containing protein [Chloroflexi bacterium]|nr:HD domain-containing protein [Chloroflexota bacterium]
MSRVLRRIARGLENLFIGFRQVDDGPAEALLAPPLLALYRRMSKADRAHSLRVLQWLRERGQDDPDLLAAALLHDCGKAAARLAVWQRTLKVLLKRFAPRQWERISRPAQPDNWRYPFYVLRIHPALGADWVAEAGGGELLVWLIRFHEIDPDPADPRFPLMRALQDADAAG